MLHSSELRGEDGKLKADKIMVLDVKDDQGKPLAMDAKAFEADMLSRIRSECVAPEPPRLRFVYPSSEADSDSSAEKGKDPMQDGIPNAEPATDK